MTTTGHGLAATWNELGELDQPYDHLEPLTPKEREVVRLVVTGRTLAEVGEALGVSRNTVHFHVKNIYDKLRVGSRVELALVAARLGWLRP
jgi:DNA-binding CsgD family transcriptional regulator